MRSTTDLHINMFVASLNSLIDSLYIILTGVLVLVVVQLIIQRSNNKSLIVFFLYLINRNQDVFHFA